MGVKMEERVRVRAGDGSEDGSEEGGKCMRVDLSELFFLRRPV
jgi:hypothetical protein